VEESVEDQEGILEVEVESSKSVPVGGKVKKQGHSLVRERW
jgi:hypothetical protein